MVHQLQPNLPRDADVRLGDSCSSLLLGASHPKLLINPNSSGSGEVCELCQRRGMVADMDAGHSNCCWDLELR